MKFVLIVALAGLMHAARTFDVGLPGDSAGTTLGFGFLLLTAYFMGRFFKQIHLPKLTGYLATGIIAGPSVLNLVSEPMVQNLKLVNGVAISLIALTAGTEMDLRSMRPLLKTIFWITATAVLGTTAILALVVFATQGMLPFMANLSPREGMMAAVVLGVVMVAQSPAVVMALRDEMRTDGPVSQVVLGVVVIGDLVVISLFAVSSSLAKAVIDGASSPLETAGLLAWEILGSGVAGVVVGFLLSLYLRKVRRSAGLFLIALSFVVAEVGQRLHFDPLLVSLSAGLFIRNISRIGDELNEQIQASSLPVYVLFFAVAGANLHLNVLYTVGVPAILYVGVRGIGLLWGTKLGAKIARAPEAVQKYAGYGLLPQAGLALALSLMFTKMFPEFGPDAGALTLGVVALNELVAPILYRLAILRSGEAGKRDATPAPVILPETGSGLFSVNEPTIK
ncbi:MAG: cation:proton antiporter [Deltaproteobacteria bacterium]|nr:cation:proton antiporter [Deltaproteobacteria bacterium]